MPERPAGWVNGVGASDARMITGMLLMTQYGGDGQDPIRVRPGIKDSSNYPGQLTLGTNTVTVNPFQAVLTNYAAQPADGAYIVTLDQPKQLTLNPANASLSRIDLVVAEILGGVFVVNIYPGTSQASPVAPTPNGSPYLALAEIQVPPVGTPPTLTDLRQFTAAANGILPVRGDTDMPSLNGPQSQLVYRLDNGTIQHRTSAGWTPYRSPQGDTWHAPTLQNGWLNYGGGYNNVGYTLMDDGWVRLRGLVKSGTISDTIFTLPVGYRPTARWLLATSTAPDVWGRVDVLPDGTVLAQSGNNAFLSLDNLSFSTY